MAYKPPPKADPQRKPKPDAKEGKVAAAVGVTEPKSEDLEDMLRRVLKQSLAELASPREESTHRGIRLVSRVEGVAISRLGERGHRGLRRQLRTAGTRVREGTPRRPPTPRVETQGSRGRR